MNKGYDILNEIKEKIADADLVLVGIGEQVAVPTKKMDVDEKYATWVKDGEKVDLYPYLQQIFVDENKEKYLEFYNRLYELIKEKNYYVLTTNVDDVIFESAISDDRIVAPCGSIHSCVCSECKGEIVEVEKTVVEKNKQSLYNDNINDFDVKKCEVCGKVMTPNIVTYEYYDENGYLDKWNRYTKWLQGTVNKKLCILELGVGLNYPTVIRWPNERIVTYNNKAYMYRIHDKLYQLSEGIGDRAKSVPENPMIII